MVLSFFEETLPYTVITWRWSTHVIWAGSLNVLLKHPGAFKALEIWKKAASYLFTFLPSYLWIKNQEICIFDYVKVATLIVVLYNRVFECLSLYSWN